VSKQSIKENRNIFEGVVISKNFLGRIFDSLVSVGDVTIRVEIPSYHEITEGDLIHLYWPPHFCIALPVLS